MTGLSSIARHSRPSVASAPRRRSPVISITSHHLNGAIAGIVLTILIFLGGLFVIDNYDLTGPTAPLADHMILMRARQLTLTQVKDVTTFVYQDEVHVITGKKVGLTGPYGSLLYFSPENVDLSIVVILPSKIQQNYTWMRVDPNDHNASETLFYPLHRGAIGTEPVLKKIARFAYCQPDPCHTYSVAVIRDGQIVNKYLWHRGDLDLADYRIIPATLSRT